MLPICGIFWNIFIYNIFSVEVREDLFMGLSSFHKKKIAFGTPFLVKLHYKEKSALSGKFDVTLKLLKSSRINDFLNMCDILYLMTRCFSGSA